MPDVSDYENEQDWMGACVPMRIEEGDEQEQAVAVCLSMWRDREKKSVKIGARNSASDRERVRTIRKAARQIDALSLEIEPNDEDAQPEQPEVMFDPDKALVAFGNTVKALGDGRIGGYLVTFSSPKDPDLTADFFTKKTEFGTNLNPPLFYHHGMDGTLKTRILAKGSIKYDDAGVWYEAQLAMRDEYEQYIYQMIENGKMGYSSGAMSHLVEREQVGKAWWIKTWIIGEASLTPTPAEPRNTVIPLKSLGAINIDREALAQAGQSAQGDDLLTKAINVTEVTAMPEITLTQERLTELVKTAALEAVKGLPAVNQPPVNVAVTKDEADQPFASPGEFFKAVKNAALYPAHEDMRLRPLKATGMSEGVPADGGYLVPQETSSGIIERMLATGEILRRISLDPVTGNSMLYNGIDETTHSGSLYGGIIGYWLAEAGTKTSSKPKFYQIDLKLKKVAALCYATDELLEDVATLQSWLMRTVPNVLRFYAEDAIIEGDGVGKPLGINNSPCVINPLRVDANKVQAADIATMWSRRWTGVNDYVWLINPGVNAQLAQLAVTYPVYVPPGGFSATPYGTIYGKPVIETEYCQALGTTGDIMLASLSQYQAISKGGVQTASSIHVAFTTDETAYRFVYRIDGAPAWHSALTPLHGSTVSPFISLSSASS